MKTLPGLSKDDEQLMQRLEDMISRHGEYKWFENEELTKMIYIKLFSDFCELYWMISSNYNFLMINKEYFVEQRRLSDVIPAGYLSRYLSFVRENSISYKL